MSAVMRGELRRESRAFNYALAFSLLLHALLLFGLPGPTASKRPSLAPALITARLVAPQALPAAPAVAPPAPIARPALRPAPQLEPAAPVAPSIPASPPASDEGTSAAPAPIAKAERSEEHTSELQSPCNLVCRLLLEKKKKNAQVTST